MLRRAARRLSAYWHPETAAAPATHAPHSAASLTEGKRLIRPYAQALERAHYLAMHDAAKAVLPNADVVAHVSHRAPYQAHMTVNGDGDGPTPGAVATLAPVLSDALARPKLRIPGASAVPLVRIHPGQPKLTVSFSPKAHMVITFGRRGVTLKDLHAAPTDAEREALRPSLGGHMEGFAALFAAAEEPQLATALAYLKQFLGGYGGMREEDARDMPTVYLAAHLWYVNEDEDKNLLPITMARIVHHRLPTLDYPLYNPALYGEDLNTLAGPVAWLQRHGNAWATAWARGGGGRWGTDLPK